MNWFNKMERKYGKYAIKNLPLYIAIIYAFGFLFQSFKPEWACFVTLNPYAILHGQVWRLVSWILVPESSMKQLSKWYSSVYGSLRHYTLDDLYFPSRGMNIGAELSWLPWDAGTKIMGFDFRTVIPCGRKFAILPS